MRPDARPLIGFATALSSRRAKLLTNLRTPFSIALIGADHEKRQSFNL